VAPDDRDPLARPKTLKDRLISRAGSVRRAEMVIDEVRLVTGVTGESDENCLAALGLMRLGMDPASVARDVTWQEFESLCAGILRASGYRVRKSVMLKRPRRQIDIIAESATLGLSIDCKHWKNSPAVSSLSGLVEAQVQRTLLYKRDSKLIGDGLPILPMLLTLLDSQTRVVDDVPVVPIILLRDFLLNLSRYDDFAFL
jgi:hypothetical protein